MNGVEARRQPQEALSGHFMVQGTVIRSVPRNLCEVGFQQPGQFSEQLCVVKAVPLGTSELAVLLP
jgi:hypothetical protein